MRLKEIMRREVEVVRPGATLADAATLMRLSEVGLLPVCDRRAAHGSDRQA